MVHGALQIGQLYWVPEGEWSECGKQRGLLLEQSQSEIFAIFQRVIPWVYREVMSGEEIDCKELLKLVTSLQTLTACQQQVNINNFVSQRNTSHSWTSELNISSFQLRDKTGAGVVFLVPVDHTESDNLHIQVTLSLSHQDSAPPLSSKN